MTMATRKRRDEGANNGEDNGEDNGGMLDFDTFVDKLREVIGSLSDVATCTEPDREGRSFGKRLGKMALEPLDTLDDRLEAEWPGPRTIIIRTRSKDGSWAPFVGRLPLAGPRASSAPAAPQSSDPAVAALHAHVVHRLDAVEAATRNAPSAPKLNEQVGALDSLASVFAKMMPAQAAPASKGLSADEVTKLLELGKAMGGGGVAGGLAEKALETFKDSGNELFKSIAGLIAMKVTTIGTTNEEREAAALERKAAAKAALDAKGEGEA
jgi:hypothetical protein